MRQLAPHDRPREKLERLGAGALGDNELLALVLAGGSAARDALSLANELLDRFGGLRGLTRVASDDLRLVRGVVARAPGCWPPSSSGGARSSAKQPNVLDWARRARSRRCCCRNTAPVEEHFGW
jgi:DNA repair protein RadC